MLKVLIVDDEAVVRRGIVLGVDWASMGCVVVGEASNGEEGIAAAEQYSPNLIITDVRMPKMDGIAMMQELRRRGSRAHVIMLTAYSDFDYARSALQFGADDYLLKPFQDKELVAAAIKYAAAQRHAHIAADVYRRGLPARESVYQAALRAVVIVAEGVADVLYHALVKRCCLHVSLPF